MKYLEEAAVFACGGESLVGVLSLPERPFDTGVVVIVGGPQYRAGSHRQFVLLARALAAAGYACLRFDYRGMGDSTGAQRDFEQVHDDIAAAVGHMATHVAGVLRVVLWGLCDGASAALLYCHERTDPRVTGLCLLNPWVRSPASLARTQVKHYYGQRLMQPSFWAKLLRGGVSLSAGRGLIARMRAAAGEDGAGAPASYQHRMALAWRDPRRRLLLLLSGDDLTAKEFLDRLSSDAAWHGAERHPRLERHDLPRADHTFSEPMERACVERLTVNWLNRLAGPTEAADRMALP